MYPVDLQPMDGQSTCWYHHKQVDAYQSAFGRHIRYVRTLRGATQEDVAHRTGVHVTYLSGIERGRRNPSLKSIRAIAKALEVETADLFAFETGRKIG